MRKQAILLLALLALQRVFALDQARAGGAGPSGKALRLYWGDVHGHTGASDGKGSVAEYFRYARDAAKLDFAMVTDHDFGNKAPWRMPKAYWQSLQTQARELTVDGTFVAIEGAV